MNQGFLIFFCATVFMSSCSQEIDKRLQSIEQKMGTISDSLSSFKSQRISLGRFKIIQSPLAAKGTFKLDTHSGDVYQLVVNKNNEESWDKLRRIGHSDSDLLVEDQQNYEVFLSTLAIRFTYLININTGATWQLVADPNTEENYFSAIDE